MHLNKYRAEVVFFIFFFLLLLWMAMFLKFKEA